LLYESLIIVYLVYESLIIVYLVYESLIAVYLMYESLIAVYLVYESLIAVYLGCRDLGVVAEVHLHYHVLGRTLRQLSWRLLNNNTVSTFVHTCKYK
jgi:hypothetical protein